MGSCSRPFSPNASYCFEPPSILIKLNRLRKESSLQVVCFPVFVSFPTAPEAFAFMFRSSLYSIYVLVCGSYLHFRSSHYRMLSLGLLLQLSRYYWPSWTWRQTQPQLIQVPYLIFSVIGARWYFVLPIIFMFILYTCVWNCFSAGWLSGELVSSFPSLSPLLFILFWKFNWDNFLKPLKYLDLYSLDPSPFPPSKSTLLKLFLFSHWIFLHKFTFWVLALFSKHCNSFLHETYICGL